MMTGGNGCVVEGAYANADNAEVDRLIRGGRSRKTVGGKTRKKVGWPRCRMGELNGWMAGLHECALVVWLKLVVQRWCEGGAELSLESCHQPPDCGAGCGCTTAHGMAWHGFTGGNKSNTRRKVARPSACQPASTVK